MRSFSPGMVNREKCFFGNQPYQRLAQVSYTRLIGMFNFHGHWAIKNIQYENI